MLPAAKSSHTQAGSTLDNCLSETESMWLTRLKKKNISYRLLTEIVAKSDSSSSVLSVTHDSLGPFKGPVMVDLFSQWCCAHKTLFTVSPGSTSALIAQSHSLQNLWWLPHIRTVAPDCIDSCGTRGRASFHLTRNFSAWHHGRFGLDDPLLGAILCVTWCLTASLAFSHWILPFQPSIPSIISTKNISRQSPKVLW